MGIDGLSPFLKEKSPGCLTTRPLNFLTGHRLAIDGHNWLYAHFSTIHRNVINSTDVTLVEPDRQKMRTLLLEEGVRFNLYLMSAGIHPVWIFDGAHPVEKSETQAERRAQKDKVKTKIADLKASMAERHQLEITGSYIQELRKLMCQIVVLTSDEIEVFQGMLFGCGLPSITAKGEGEKLASVLCRENQVSAVLSTDTDCLVYGVPMLVTEIDRYQHTCRVMDARQAVIDLGLSPAEFVDFAILAGCDYNQHIPDIGIKGAFKFIEKYRTLDQLNYETVLSIKPSKKKLGREEVEKQIAGVRVEVCRRLFTMGSSKEEVKVDEDDKGSAIDEVIKLGMAEINRDMLEQYQLSQHIPVILTTRKQMPTTVARFLRM